MTNIEITGFYCDGNTSKRQDCVLRVDAHNVVYLEGTAIKPFGLDQLVIPSRIGNTPRVIQLPSGGFFETLDNNAVDSISPAKPWFNPHDWESKLRYLIASVVLVIGVAFVLVVYAIPYAAKQIAFSLSPEMSTSLAEGSLDHLDKYYFSPTTIDKATRDRLRDIFTQHLPENSSFQFQLHFRNAEDLGANAFALPNGSVVVTDELVKLADNDEQIISILLHEIGHVVNRHSLRGALEASGIYALYSWITGDMETASTLIIALPTILVQSQYSQNLELEADTYSLEMMQANGLDPIHFATIMEKLEASHSKIGKKSKPKKEDTDSETEGVNKDGSDKNSSNKSNKKEIDFFDYISSHPPTEERIKRFREASRSRTGD